MSERKLLTVRRIQEIRDLPNADLIQHYRVDGWWVISKKDGFKVGDLALYAEVDSFVPHELAPFLSKGKEPSEFNGIKGERLKTIRMKGVLSQGLLLPLSSPFNSEDICAAEEGQDWTEAYNIQKWEPPMNIPGVRYCQAKGTFPYFLRKTDQERIQNIYWDDIKDDIYTVTEKLDGSSMSVYIKDDIFGVCSRNQELKLDTNESNAFIETAIKYDLISKIKSTGKNICIQGELCGPGIQGNKYNLKEFHFFGFDVFDIDKQEYYLPYESYALFNSLNIQMVPIWINLTKIDTLSKDQLLENAQRNSILNGSVLQEGFVYSSNTKPSISFKVISNSWLLKHKE